MTMRGREAWGPVLMMGLLQSALVACLPWLIERTDLSAGVWSMIFSVGMLPVLLTAPLWGRLVDLQGARRVSGLATLLVLAGFAVVLGVPETGESCRTGTRPGFRADFPETRNLLLFLRERARKEGRKKVCKISPDYPAGPMHTSRHTGPSEDALVGYRRSTQIRNRGRRRGKTSVFSYAKTHALLAAKAKASTKVNELGRERMRSLGVRAAKAIL